MYRRARVICSCEGRSLELHGLNLAAPGLLRSQERMQNAPRLLASPTCTPRPAVQNISATPATNEAQSSRRNPVREARRVVDLPGDAVAVEEQPFHLRPREGPRAEPAEHRDLPAGLVHRAI